MDLYITPVTKFTKNNYAKMESIPIDVVRHIISFLDYESRMNANLIFLDNPNDRVVKSIKKDAIYHEVYDIVQTCMMYICNVNTATNLVGVTRSENRHITKIKVKNTTLLFKYIIKKKEFIGYLGDRFINSCKIKLKEIIDDINNIRFITNKDRLTLLEVSYELFVILYKKNDIKDITTNEYKPVEII